MGLQGVSDPCPDTTPGIHAHLFLTLINALVASKCRISSPDNYPFDYSSQLNDQDEFDFIVVGAGSAGSVAANKLSENPNWKVLVLEAGGLPSTTSEIPSLLFSSQGTPEDWQYATEPSQNSCLGFKNNQCLWPRGKCLGGSSSINAMLYVRGNERDYDQWAQQGNPGWDHASVLETFKELEDVQVEELTSSNHYGRHGFLPLTRYNAREPIEDVIKTSARSLGVPTVPLEQNLGYWDSIQNIHKGVRANTGKVFLGGAKQRLNLKVALHAFVEKVVIQDGRASGVVVNLGGRRVTIKARKEVILAGGAINSPQLLMLSGVGPKKHLNDLGIPLVADLPVGENLQDHVMFTGLYMSIPNTVKAQNPRPLDDLYRYFMYQEGEAAQISITNLIGFINTRNDSTYPDIQLVHIIFPQNDNYLLREIHRVFGYKDKFSAVREEANTKSPTLQIVPVLLNPKSSGRILLKSKNAEEKPLIYANYFNEADDVETLVNGVKFVVKLLESDSFKKYKPQLVDMNLDECGAFDYSDKYWKCAVRHLSSTLYHPAGTCKMGPKSDKTSVVDSRLRVHGIGNLRVMDASIMPRITSGNTNAPCMMIGRKGATFVAEDWTNLHEEF